LGLSPGTRIGPYEVVALLGSGGMGEVYRARDTELDRDVALKILPQAFAADPERLARFEREAKTLAALNHPNIAAIFGIASGRSTAGDPHAGVRALVMELVPGRTLDEVCGDGRPLSPNAAVRIAAQIAEALEAAHDAGIVHRDLKPANIKLRDDDVVKLLDFGLARAIVSADASGSADTMASPTMLSPAATQQGVILGTAGYMSPEQARGRVADKRSDIWAFGVVLYEMLTGKRLFTGDTVTEVIATVIKDAPDLTALPAETPPRLRALIERCLDRDVKTRLRDIGEARVALSRINWSPGSSDPANEPVAVGHGPTGTAAAIPRGRPSARELAAWALAATAMFVALGLWLTRAPGPSSSDVAGQVIRSMIVPPDNHVFDFDVTVGPAVLSPDGRFVAFSARSRDNRIQLWVRALDAAEARPIEGTDDASFPFWSPDSRSIGFYSSSRGRIERVDVNGGAPVAIVRAAYVRGASWGPDGLIAYDSSDGGAGISVVSVSGGTPRRIVESGLPRSPWILPDGKHLLYLSREEDQVRVIGIDGAGDAPVIEASSNAIYVSGQLLYMREGTLLAQPFDLSRRTVSGTAVALARGVHMLLGSDARGVFSASETGLLLYQTGAAEAATSLAWFDPAGTRQSIVGEMGAARGVFLSPDNQYAAVGIADVEGKLALWRVNLSNLTRNRLTFATGADDVSAFLTWAPDGRHVAYSARQNGRSTITRTPAAGGQAESLFELPAEHTQALNARVTAWTKDGATILYANESIGGMWRLHLKPVAPGSTPTATPLLKDAPNALNVQLSLNERWIAFQSSVGTGTVPGVFVDAYPGGGRRQTVSERATLPRWSDDGKALYFALDNQLSVVDVTEADGDIRFGAARPLMPVIVGRGYSYDVSDDGRILALITSERRAGQPLTLVQNWLAGLRKD
jgi:Tol biopolymer transport system component/tRNA A-37 threonylcarbamoyl transferase component Bud32